MRSELGSINRQALAVRQTGGLMGLFKQYLKIAQSFRVALRQLRGDLVLRGQQVFECWRERVLRLSELYPRNAP